MAKQKNYDQVLTRLLLILKKLSQDERPTILDLSMEFNVSTRTIQKDIYQRLGNITDIHKDQFGRLKFGDNFDLCNAA